jgi:hypothetical protein
MTTSAGQTTYQRQGIWRKGAALLLQQFSIRQTLAAYDPEDIFNCDETGLFWKMSPNRSLSTVPKLRISIYRFIGGITRTRGLQGPIMEEWLRWFDDRMRGRKVVLMDDFFAYEVVFASINNSQPRFQNRV